MLMHPCKRIQQFGLLRASNELLASAFLSVGLELLIEAFSFFTERMEAKYFQIVFFLLAMILTIYNVHNRFFTKKVINNSMFVSIIKYLFY